MRVERKGGGKYGRASCCRIGWRRDEGERRAKGWAGRGRSEKRLLNAMEARLSKRGGKLGVSDAVENARRSYAAGLSWGLMESVSSASRNRVAFLSYDQDLYAHECWFCRGDPASFIPRQFRLLWCAMKLYLGYIGSSVLALVVFFSPARAAGVSRHAARRDWAYAFVSRPFRSVSPSMRFPR